MIYFPTEQTRPGEPRHRGHKQSIIRPGRERSKQPGQRVVGSFGLMLVYNPSGMETLKHVKGALLAISVFFLYIVIFTALFYPMHVGSVAKETADMEIFLGSLCATVLTVFLYRKIAKRLSL